MSTSNDPTSEGHPRARSATLIAGGTTLGLAVAAVIFRQETDRLPTSIIAGMVAATVIAVVLAVIWQTGGLRQEVTFHVPTRRPRPRPYPAEQLPAQPQQMALTAPERRAITGGSN